MYQLTKSFIYKTLLSLDFQIYIKTFLDCLLNLSALISTFYIRKYS
jgi:hypothetical protein